MSLVRRPSTRAQAALAQLCLVPFCHQRVWRYIFLNQKGTIDAYRVTTSELKMTTYPVISDGLRCSTMSSGAACYIRTFGHYMPLTIAVCCGRQAQKRGRQANRVNGRQEKVDLRTQKKSRLFRPWGIILLS